MWKEENETQVQKDIAEEIFMNEIENSGKL